MLSMLPTDLSMKDKLFLSVIRETGVIPAALAGLLLGMKAPGAQMIATPVANWARASRNSRSVKAGAPRGSPPRAEEEVKAWPRPKVRW